MCMCWQDGKVNNAAKILLFIDNAKYSVVLFAKIEFIFYLISFFVGDNKFQGGCVLLQYIFI